MDEDILRLPSNSSSDSCRSGAPQTFHFQNCAPSSYHVVNTNNSGRPLPSVSAASYSQFLPATSAASTHSLPPPPGLPHPGLSGIYEFPPQNPPPSSYHQSIHYTPDNMPVASSSSARLAENFSSTHSSIPSAKPTGGQYNGYGIQNGGLSTYSNYPYYRHVPQHQQHPHQNNMPSDGPLLNVNQQFSKTYDQGAYQQMAGMNGFNDRLNLVTDSKNKNNYYENEGAFANDFLQAQLKASLIQEANTNGNSTSYAQAKDECNMNGVGSVMNPIIENLMGSMAMCNGTYTHFGPISKAVGLNGQTESPSADVGYPCKPTNTNFEPVHKTLFSKVAVTPISHEKRDSDVLAAAPVDCVAKPEPTRQIPLIPEQNVNVEPKQITPKPSSYSVAGTSEQRSASPKDSSDSNSRPQTPGKPSYLEVLTKVGLKNHGNSPSRKTSSSSSSPVQSSFSANGDSAPSLAHRKSVDIFIGSASTPPSSCPSTSSSPATKQRNAGINSKGKENVSSSNSSNKKHSSGIDRNSPSNSPSHQTVNNPYQYQSKKTGGNATGDERKVLSSQNNSSKQTKTSKGGRTSVEKANSFEDVKDDSGEWGWRTYTSRSRNNNVNNIGNKNSQKRNSSGQNSLDSVINHLKDLDDEDDEDDDDGDLDERRKQNGGNDDIIQEKKSGFSNFTSLNSSGGGLTSSHVRKQREREKEKSRNSKKDDRICSARRWIKGLAYLWLTHMISALSWLWSLVADVASLSASLGMSLMHDFYSWTKTQALPNVTGTLNCWKNAVMQTCQDGWRSCVTKVTSFFRKGGQNGQENNSQSGIEFDKNILTVMGPDRNIALPANGDEAMKRLLAVKDQDPYSILGVRSDCNDETIRRYYRRQAVLVHPDKNLIVGAEEAFKILARAFELVGDPVKRADYHQKLMEAHAKEKFCGEIGNLLEQLRKKMEAASSTIRCTKCNSRHKKNVTDRPLFAARYCSQCRIHHGAREGELWAERKGWFGITWNYFACMDGHVWEINEWARCQKANLKHIKADAHCVMYRLVAGGNNHNQNNSNQQAHGNGTAGEDGAGSEADEWDSLINNLYKSPGSGYGKANGTSSKPGCCGNGSLNNNGNSSGAQAPAKRRKGKRTK